MSRSSWQKDRHKDVNEVSGNVINEGTAARTRPFSFEEIMLRRKQKKMAEDAKERAGEPMKLVGKDGSESASDHSECEGGYRQKKGSILGAAKHVSQDTLKDISRKKEGNVSKRVNDIVKGNRELEAVLKVRSNKDKSNKIDKYEKRSHHGSKADERLKSDFENESEKKRSKDATVKDKHGEREKSSHRESKRKHQSGSAEKNRSEIDWSASKKHDSGKWQDAEYSERRGWKKESAQSHHEEVRQKRRRSRSREHVRDRDRDRDRDRRSSSTSPRAHKHLSYHGRDHEESSYYSSKDRSGRHDKHKISSNGAHGSGNFRRHGHSSGLGGYSPRKRRTEAAIKTPSPTIRSPERKSAGWDLPPPVTDKVGASAGLLASVQSLHQSTSSNTHELPSAATVTLTASKVQSAGSPNTTLTTKDVSVDSIQLTQATRPMRRLYVENVPASASDKAIKDCFNDFLLFSGVNRILGTEPCISCLINKEKGQALLEFLTPEDATSALSFDGRSLSGCTLNVRRPKDFVEPAVRRSKMEPATGIQEKPATTVTAISDVVKDSQQKIFVGGISKALTSDMLMEIVSAFGPLKAYRFEANEGFDETFAFLEYIDQSVTLRACAGLNGMKLGGNVLTVVQATPDADGEETTGRPFYGIPDHAKPLLEKPTQILKIKNVFKQEEFLLLSESELEETLEDVRLECARFGTVKSINFIKYDSNCAAAPEVNVNNDSNGNEGGIEEFERDFGKIVSPKEHPNADSTEAREANSPFDVGAGCDAEKVLDDLGVGEMSIHDPEKHEQGEPEQLDNNLPLTDIPKHDMTEDDLASSDKGEAMQNEVDKENHLVPENPIPEEGDGELQVDCIEPVEPIGEKSDIGNNAIQHEACDQDLFEQGLIIVEYARKEAAIMAAHCLHGRIYGDQTVVTGYVPYDLYQTRFPR